MRHCLLTPSNSGYVIAKDILRREFGRPHDIIQAVTKDVVEGRKRTNGDIEGLRTFVTQMRTWELTLSQLSNPSEINCSTNLVRIVYRLPKSLQDRWADVAEAVIDNGREPSFSELLQFVERRVSVASNLYGKIASSNLPSPDKSRSREEARRGTHSRITTLRLHATDSPTVSEVICVHCRDSHDLTRCIAFEKLDHALKVSVLRRHKRCFRCMKPNHTARDCKVTLRCMVDGCRGQHHTLMHSYVEGGVEKKYQVQSNCSAMAGPKMIALGFVPVRVLGPNCSVITYALVDNGSDSTLILESLAQKLGLKGTQRDIHFKTINSSKAWKSRVVPLSVQSLVGDTETQVDNAFTVRSLPYEVAPIITAKVLAEYPHLIDVYPIDYHDRRVGLLIGCDLLDAHISMEQRVGNSHQPFATRTPFGWIVRGSFDSKPTNVRSINSLGVTEESLAECLAKFYELEFKDEFPCKKGLSVEDDEAICIANNSIKLLDGHYVVGLPMRQSLKLPNNYTMVSRRLELLRKRSIRDPVLSA